MTEGNNNATFYDGVSGRRRTVALRTGIVLEIVEDDTLIASWPWETLRRVDAARGLLRLTSTGAPELARLEITSPSLISRISEMAPRFRGDETTSVSSFRIVGWSLAAAVSIIVVAIYGVPLAADRLAPMIPNSVETRLGTMVDNQVKAIFGDKACSGEEGSAALKKMVAALEKQGGLPFEAQTAVINNGIPNAFALPGGKVYVFKGLLEVAQSPDELAGVLAHELGHVAHRDGMRRLIQTGGTSWLIGLLFGDISGSGAAIFMTRQVLDASYSREAESAADVFAAKTMKGLGRSPEPLGELLVRVTGAEKSGISDIIASHPVSIERLEAMKKLAVPETGKPILSFGEWRALKAICNQKP